MTDDYWIYFKMFEAMEIEWKPSHQKHRSKNLIEI